MLARKQNFVNRILFGSHDRNINFDNFDFTTITISIFLAFFGILMVSSISFNELTSRHIFNLMVGFVLFFFIFRVEMSTWRNIDLYLIFLSFAGLFPSPSRSACTASSRTRRRQPSHPIGSVCPPSSDLPMCSRRARRCSCCPRRRRR